VKVCPECQWQLSLEAFPDGFAICQGCLKDAKRALSRPAWPQKASCAGCTRHFFRWTAYRKFCTIECARRNGERVA
jgi:hypothetical protein